MSMSTLINGADAGVAIITSAVAAANATLTRAHQVVGQVDGLAANWAQSPIGNIVGARGVPVLLRGPTGWRRREVVGLGAQGGCQVAAHLRVPAVEVLRDPHLAHGRDRLREVDHRQATGLAVGGHDERARAVG